MNLALLGDDPALGDWAARAAACGGRVVVACVDSALPGSFPIIAASSVTALADWRTLLNNAEIDAVLVGGSSPLIAAAAFELARTRPLLVLPRPEQYATDIGLLDLHRPHGPSAVPAFPLRCEPAVGEYLHRFQAGEMGDLRLLKLDRTVPVAASAAHRIPQALAARCFLEDADLLRWLGGEFDRVTTVRLGTLGDAAAQTTVTLASEGEVEAVWTLTPGAGQTWRLVIEGTKTRATLQRSGDAPIELQIGATPRDASPVTVVSEPAVDRCLREFIARAGGASPAGGTLVGTAGPDWSDAARAFALVAAVEESVRRRRTVPPRYAGNSERDQFKTQMTAIGCGVLTWTLLGVCTGLILGRVLDPRDSLERRAAAARTIVWRDDFDARAATLTPAARERLQTGLRQDASEAIVLIEAGADADAARLDPLRRQAVEELWAGLGRGDRPPQIDVRPLAGRGFRRLMLAVWGAAFLPLAIFLAAQALILLTRP